MKKNSLFTEKEEEKISPPLKITHTSGSRITPAKRERGRERERERGGWEGEREEHSKHNALFKFSLVLRARRWHTPQLNEYSGALPILYDKFDSKALHNASARARMCVCVCVSDAPKRVRSWRRESLRLYTQTQADTRGRIKHREWQNIRAKSISKWG